MSRLVVMDVCRHEPTTEKPFVGYTISLGDGETVLDVVWTDEAHGESFMSLFEHLNGGQA